MKFISVLGVKSRCFIRIVGIDQYFDDIPGENAIIHELAEITINHHENMPVKYIPP